MKLLINNSTDKPITLFIEPWCEERKFPPGAEAIVYFGDMDLHAIDIHENQLSIYDEGTKDFSIEVILKEEKVFAESLRLAYTWLHKLGGKDAAVAMEESAEVIEGSSGYLRARSQVFGAFHSGFQTKDAEPSPVSDALPVWQGPETLAAPYLAGGTAAHLNFLARSEVSFPGPGVGPFDTDTVRSAFERAAALNNAAKQR